MVRVREYPGITANIYRQDRTKPNSEGKPHRYTSFLLAYSLLGKRKLESYSELAGAEQAGKEAIKRIAEGQQAVLELTNRDREQYQRAVDLLTPLGVALDVVAQECVDVRDILNGTGTPVEAARFFVKHHAKELPRITVVAAVDKCLAQARADKKSKARMHQLEFFLNGFAESINVEVTELTPGIVSRYLTGMTAGERTKKNARDVIGYFGRWLVLHGYLARGTDLTEGVQRYGMKSGEIHIFTVDEIKKLVENASARLLPYIVIGAWAGLRGAEIQRLDWSEVDLQDGFIEVKGEKAKTETRRLVPIKPNLAVWLKDVHKKSGAVCPFKNVVNQLMKLVATINKALPKGSPDKDKLRWKRNALRHSYISYRVAECADVPRVADESGNSVTVIRINYLKRLKPQQAQAWFDVMPAGTSNEQKQGTPAIASSN